MNATAVLPRKRVSRKTTGVQYAALPYRLNGEALEILLITSRRTRRWIVPKGWPMEGCRPAACAAREALEEAGVAGPMARLPIGHFRYLKELRMGVELPCRVEVFALKVTREQDTWQEQNRRERRWFPAAEAAGLVGEPQLKLVIQRFATRLISQRKRKNGTDGTAQK
jgi:8-oxo-dGTP pyrophosphatase MutT (NUDIX family)